MKRTNQRIAELLQRLTQQQPTRSRNFGGSAALIGTGVAVGAGVSTYIRSRLSPDNVRRVERAINKTARLFESLVNRSSLDDQSKQRVVAKIEEVKTELVSDVWQRAQNASSTSGRQRATSPEEQSIEDRATYGTHSPSSRS